MTSATVLIVVVVMVLLALTCFMVIFKKGDSK